MDYLIYCFSATGNTAHGVDIIAAELRSRGDQVSVIAVDRDTRHLDGFPDRLLIAFPTFSWVPPVLVQRFLRRLPRGKKPDGSRVRAAVFTADGGDCLQAPEQARRMLRRRGYDVFLTGRASYPDNWQQFIPGPDAETRTRLIATGEEMTRAFARKLLSEEASRYRVASFHQLWSRVVGSLFAFFGRRFMGKMFIADRDCTACGICVRACPVGAILLPAGEQPRPFWKMNCESCNRCINICPEKAVVCSPARIAVLITAIIGMVMAVLGLYNAYLKPLLVAAVPAMLSGIVNFLAAAALVIGVHFLVIGPLDRFGLRYLQRLPGLERIFTFGYNKRSRRYLMPGYRPPQSRSGRPV